VTQETINAVNALEAFAAQAASVWSPQPFNELIPQWNIPPLTRDDLVARSKSLSLRIASLKEDQIDAILKAKLSRFPLEVAWFQSNTLPQLQGGNAPQVISNFDIIMSSMEQALPSAQTDWVSLDKANLIPRELSRKIRNINAGLDSLDPDIQNLTLKVNTINEAHAAASDFPSDLQSLRESRDQILEYSNNARKIFDKIESSEILASDKLNKIVDSEETAQRLVSGLDSAYSAATTIGLAGAFTERANKLNWSVSIWVFLLIVTLTAGSVVGYLRLQSFQLFVAQKGVASQWIWINAVMSVMVVAAPVWFAWVATRQIGQRFRLAENYGFKAALARAYEGYRKEAARLDPELEIRLFSSALDRLDEAPLRFLTIEEHNSPYEALLASPGFQKAIERLPDFRDGLSVLLARVVSPSGSVTSEAARFAQEHTTKVD
jgi:hypothetical protein